MNRQVDFSPLIEVFKKNKEEAELEFSPLFYSAHQGFFEDPLKFEGYIECVLNLAELLGIKGKSILDIGCGSGLMSVIFALAAAEKVIGVDLNPEVIGSFNKLVLRFNPAITNIYPQVGDGISLNYEDDSFDVVVACDVISHAREIRPFLNEIKRVLRRDGKLFICDSNNSLDIRGNISKLKYWRKVENGPCDDPRLPQKPFLEIRKEMIKEEFSNLSDKEIERIAKLTRGLWGNEVISEARRFIETGSMNKKKGFAFIDPRTGFLAEQTFNPFKIAGLVNSLGFGVRLIAPFSRHVYPYFMYSRDDRRPRCWLNVRAKIILRFFYPVSLFFSTNFALIAVNKK